VAMTPDRLMLPDGTPNFGLTFYAVNKRGEAGAASMRPTRYAVFDGKEAVVRDTAYLYPRAK
jgi:hypothetical protein